MKLKINLLLLFIFILSNCSTLKIKKNIESADIRITKKLNEQNLINIDNENIEISELENNKNKARVKFHISNLYFYDENYNAALQYLLEALQLDTANAYYHYKLGEIYSILRNIPKAKRYYLNSLMLMSENPDIYYKLGKLYLLENSPKIALNYLIKAFNSKNQYYSKDTEFLFNLANAYYLNGLYENALFYYKQCSDAYYNNPAILYNIGLSYYMTNDLNNAEKSFLQVLELNENYFEAYIQLMQIYSLQNNLDEADKVFNKFLSAEFSKSDSKKKDVFLTSAGIYFANNDRLDAAISAFEKLIEKYPQNSNVIFMLAKLYFYNDKFDSALPLFTQLAEKKNEMPEPFIFLGYIYQRKMAFRHSIINFEKALKLRPNIPELWLMLATAYSKNKQDTDALNLLERAVKYENLKTPEIYYYLAYLYFSQKNSDMTFHYYEQIIEHFPNYADAHIYNYVGYSYLEKNINFDTAFDFISRAVKEQPDNPYYLDSLGWYYYLTQDYKKSLEIFNKIDLENFQDAVVYEHCGDVLYKLGDYEKSLEWYEKSYNIDKREELKNKIKNLKKNGN
ncbi:MAG TPA: tetratricopeptide repeat protein [bacterium]|nr:tetratricopeptide repeat protein [bacterium]HPP87758.1 tetratricopeptide repeat protein [bacterium]